MRYVHSHSRWRQPLRHRRRTRPRPPPVRRTLRRRCRARRVLHPGARRIRRPARLEPRPGEPGPRTAESGGRPHRRMGPPEPAGVSSARSPTRRPRTSNAPTCAPDCPPEPASPSFAYPPTPLRRPSSLWSVGRALLHHQRRARLHLRNPRPQMALHRPRRPEPAPPPEDPVDHFFRAPFCGLEQGIKTPMLRPPLTRARNVGICESASERPNRSIESQVRKRCSPRTRGWSLGPRRAVVAGRVLPAHAGMVPSASRTCRPPRRAPRARGDGPDHRVRGGGPPSCSPRTRGWSHDRRVRGEGRVVLPAHAGMVPPASRTAGPPTGAPRARGDGPCGNVPISQGDRCSPRTRGWSPGALRLGGRAGVLPAHAGMVPRRSAVFEGHDRAPRARGDGPREPFDWAAALECSPRTRGWSPPGEDPVTAIWVLPAHAGVVPGTRDRQPSLDGAPRARGGGPVPGKGHFFEEECSPRTRGWSRGVAAPGTPRAVLPAHAGVVPRRLRAGTRARRAPRARGGGPNGTGAATDRFKCSPRTRGWSPAYGTGREHP